MKPLITASLTLVASLAFILVSCNDDSSTAPTPTAAGSQEDHEGHDHDDAGQEDDTPVDLGTTVIGRWTVKLERQEAITPGERLLTDVTLSGTDERPKALRAWYGREDGEGSLKSLAIVEPIHYHAIVEVPITPPGDSRFWIELEAEDGSLATGSFDLKR